MEDSPIKNSWGEGVKMKIGGLHERKIMGEGGSEIVNVPTPPPPMYIQIE